jgi:3-dehydroquinate synthetase
VKTLRVNLGARSYPIIVGADILEQAGCMLAGLGFRMALIVVSNSAVLRLHGPALLRSLEQSLAACDPLGYRSPAHPAEERACLRTV